MTEQRLRTDQVAMQSGLQVRAATDDDAVAAYAEVLANGGELPPIDVFPLGDRYVVADGHHRLKAALRAGQTCIRAKVHDGDLRDALLFSVQSNHQHGLRRTNTDKRRAVGIMLADDEWSKWSDREIARRCGVNNHMVADVRKSLTGSSPSDQPRNYTDKHGNTSAMNTAAIGKGGPVPQAKSQLPALTPSTPAPQRPTTSSPPEADPQPKPSTPQIAPPTRQPQPAANVAALIEKFHSTFGPFIRAGDRLAEALPAWAEPQDRLVQALKRAKADILALWPVS
jgi:hypothetical protein